MWVLTVRSPLSEPREYMLQPGKTSLGRNPENDIVVNDDSASRLHAELEYDGATGALVLRDLGSTNGTFINRERLEEPRALRPDDQFRIGYHQLTVSERGVPRAATSGAALPATQPLTRDLVLQSVDQHALVLNEVAMRLNSILDPEVAMREVSQVARVALGADKCEVIPAARFSQLSTLGFPTSIAAQAIEQRQVVYIPDLSAELPRPPSASTLLLRIRSLLCVPGVKDDQVVVLTYAYRAGASARQFDLKDLQLAVAISHHAALTVERAQLYERTRHLEQLAITDDLTGLHNRRHFLALADQEFQRARRYHRPLSVLLLDVSNFRQVNEAHGHAAGDAVLRAVAEACREGLRESHLISRYGDDEFAVLLLECNEVMAHKVAERLRERIAAASIEAPGSRVPIAVAVCVGSAALSDYSPDLATLLRQAETALLADKREQQVSDA